MNGIDGIKGGVKLIEEINDTGFWSGSGTKKYIFFTEKLQLSEIEERTLESFGWDNRGGIWYYYYDRLSFELLRDFLEYFYKLRKG